MIIECERCHTKFNLDEGRLKKEGSRARCSVCSNVFTVFPPETGKEQGNITPAKGESEETEALFQEEEIKEEEPEEEKAGEDEISEFDKTLVQEIEESIDEEEEIEPISIDELADLKGEEEGGEEEKGPEIDRAMDRAGKVEEKVAGQIEPVEEEEEIEEEHITPRPVIKKKRKGKVLMIIGLIIIVLAGSLTAVVMFKPEMIPGNIPFISQFKPPAIQQETFDIGNRRLALKDLDGFFVESGKAGRLFVVKGTVINNYPDRRSFIRIKSTILDQTEKPIMSNIVFAGNTFSGEELKKLSLEEIKNMLNVKTGKENKNKDIPPNSSVPFMIVFSSLPENASDFTVEPVSSASAGG